MEYGLKQLYVVLVTQMDFSPVDPFWIVEQRIFSKEETRLAFKKDVPPGSFICQNADFCFSKEMNKLIFLFQTDKAQGVPFIKEKVLPFLDIYKNIQAVGINFVAFLPVDYSQKFYNEVNPFYKSFSPANDFFGANIFSDKSNYKQNINISLGEIKGTENQKCLSLSINNHFPIVTDGLTVDQIMLKTKDLKEEATALIKSLNGEDK